MPPVSPRTTRSQPRWLLVALPVLLGARVASTVYEKHHPSQPHSQVRWLSLEEARVLSRERNLPILYDFTAAWCEPCHMLERQVFNDLDAAQKINGAYLPVRVTDRMNEEGENPPEVKALQKRFEVLNFPTLVYVAPDGGKVNKLSGYRGYSETLEFLLLPSPRGFVPQKKRPPPTPPVDSPPAPAPGPAAP